MLTLFRLKFTWNSRWSVRPCTLLCRLFGVEASSSLTRESRLVAIGGKVVRRNLSSRIERIGVYHWPTRRSSWRWRLTSFCSPWTTTTSLRPPSTPSSAATWRQRVPWCSSSWPAILPKDPCSCTPCCVTPYYTWWVVSIVQHQQVLLLVSTGLSFSLSF